MSAVMVHIATLHVCPRCKGVGRGYIDDDGGKTCVTCGGSRCVDLTGLKVLAHNLAIGAALCKAFRLGEQHADDRWALDDDSRPWRPGCGRSAP